MTNATAKKPINKAYGFRSTWRFPARVEQSLPSYLESPSLHVCCGLSELGDVRVDLETQADIKSDMFHLPFKDGSFQSILIDPPWHLGNHLRPGLLWELRRVLRVGGLLLLNCFWIPRIPGMNLEKMGIMLPRTFWRNCSALGFYRKEQTTLDQDGMEIGINHTRRQPKHFTPVLVDLEIKQVEVLS